MIVVTLVNGEEMRTVFAEPNYDTDVVSFVDVDGVDLVSITLCNDGSLAVLHPETGATLYKLPKEANAHPPTSSSSDARPADGAEHVAASDSERPRPESTPAACT